SSLQIQELLPLALKSWRMWLDRSTLEAREQGSSATELPMSKRHMKTPSRGPSLFVIAVWAGTLFGLLEGIVLCISRLSPLIQAAHKVSNSALWVAPLVDIPFFLAAAAVFLVALQLLGRYLRGWELITAYGFFLFLGILTVITMPRMIQPWGAVVFSLGLAVVFARRLRG